ncbi:hypothetical protein GCM10028809_25020 [Spirosoma gilvum]
MYELSYQFYVKDKSGQWQKGFFYEALLFYYSDNSPDNVIRCTYQTSSGKPVVEQKVKSQYWVGTDGKFNWRLTGLNPRYVTICGNPTGGDYQPDSFYFKKALGETDYKPVDIDDAGGAIAKVVSFRSLSQADVTDSYLAKWCWRWKENTSTVCNLDASTLHLILVSNTNDYTLGPSFQNNHTTLYAFFKDVALSCGMQFRPIEVTGDKFGKLSVQNAVQEVRPMANDVVIFYYSGHGFRYSNSVTDYPQLILRPSMYASIDDNTLNLNYDIYQPLIKKGSRLTLVIGECCNEDINKNTPLRPDRGSLPSAGNVFNVGALKGLFCQHGSGIVATAARNQSSWYYQLVGGVWRANFLGAFLSEVAVDHSGPASWKTIMDKAKQQTVDDTVNAKVAVSILQTPVYWMDIK